MIIPFLTLTITIIILYKFRATWLHLFKASPDEVSIEEVQGIFNPKRLCPKCDKEMEEGHAIINYRDDTLPFLYPHEVPPFLRRNIRMAPTVTRNPFYPEPQKVYRCEACGLFLEGNSGDQQVQ